MPFEDANVEMLGRIHQKGVVTIYGSTTSCLNRHHNGHLDGPVNNLPGECVELASSTVVSTARPL